jgi:hypothetical protein
MLPTFIRQNRDNTGVREAASPSVRTAMDEQNQARQERSVLQETLNRQDFDANRPDYQQNISSWDDF